MTIDVFTLLEKDHRQVERLLAELEASEAGPERDAVVAQLTEALQVHMRFEETSIYPRVAQEMGGDAAEEANVEHRLARDGLAKLAELKAAPGFGAAVEMVKGGIGHHVEEEEGEMFPKMRRALPEADLTRMRTALLSAKRAAGLPPMDIDSATKDELLDLARVQGATVTTHMTKDEIRSVLA